MQVAVMVWLGLATLWLRAAPQPPQPSFRAVTVDTRVEIGYGVTVADVDGDKKLDILLADKRVFAWYRNPAWEKFVLAEGLTPQDNVCLAAQDLDGDGKAEVAVGAGWNPGDTLNSGAVFYLAPPTDRRQRWTPIALPHEPTVHRMRWIKNPQGKYDLVVVPLHGRGNQGGQGAGVKTLVYQMPADPRDPWPTELVDDTLHLTHNFEPVNWAGRTEHELVLAGREGVFHFARQAQGWVRQQLGGNPPGESGFAGAGEVRAGRLPGGCRCLVTVEPMHGAKVVVYTPRTATEAHGLWSRKVIDDSLIDGHAVACGDLLGIGADQVVVGWRAMNRPGAKVGIRLYTPLDQEGQQWRLTLVDDNTMACEDLCLADLNDDGVLDIVAAGRATKNLKLYFTDRGAGGTRPAPPGR
jgi:hypothetical protein